MIKRRLWIERIRTIENEWHAARSALQLLQERLRADPSWGRVQGWSKNDASSLIQNLEATFVTRMFAEFESALKDYWRGSHKHKTRGAYTPTKPRKGRRLGPKMVHLLTMIATREKTSQDWLDDAHDLRDYRYSIVHERTASPPKFFTVEEAKTVIC